MLFFSHDTGRQSCVSISLFIYSVHHDVDYAYPHNSIYIRDCIVDEDIYCGGPFLLTLWLHSRDVYSGYILIQRYGRQTVSFSSSSIYLYEQYFNASCHVKKDEFNIQFASTTAIVDKDIMLMVLFY